MTNPPDIIAEKVKAFKKEFYDPTGSYFIEDDGDVIIEWITKALTQVAEESRREGMPKEAPKSVMLIELQESLKLQAHYAQLLNYWDGGERRIFKSVSQWLNRLRETGTFATLTKKEDSC